MWFYLVLPLGHRKKGFVVESQTTSWWYQIRQCLSQKQKRFVIDLYEDLSLKLDNGLDNGLQS